MNIDPASPDYGDVTLVASGLGGPRGLTLNRSGNLVYLAEEFSRELGVINVDPGSPGYGSVATILNEQALRDVALNADERRAVVTDVDDGILIVDIDPSSSIFGHVVSRVTPAPLDGARGLWLNSSRTRAYVVSEFSGYLSCVVIDTTSPAFGQIERLATGLDVPVDVLVDTNAVNQDGTRAYFTQFGIETGCTGKLSWIDINPLSATYLKATPPHAMG